MWNGYWEICVQNTRCILLQKWIYEVEPSLQGMLIILNLKIGYAFFDVDDDNRTFTADRAEFIGRNGTLANPEAMNRTKLSGKIGAALDPVQPYRLSFDLAEEEENEMIFRLGAGKNINEVLSIIQTI